MENDKRSQGAVDLACEFFRGRDNDSCDVVSFCGFFLAQDSVNKREEEREGFPTSRYCLL